ALQRAIGITRVANITGLDRIGIPVVTVCRPNARSLSVSQGKGVTLAAARASGLMEATELYHAEHVLRPLVSANVSGIRRSRRVIDVERIDLSSVDDSTCRALLDRSAAARIDVAVWETTTDVQVPSFLCQIADLVGERPGSGAHGMGCHPDRRIALCRALTEAAQCR